ncbi:MAG: T9SS sorting signal type C domain-containing protein [Flavobacterium sp.]|nr:T9SS sorting signal type C domain-containing protein [Flavobacterium sp.]
MIKKALYKYSAILGLVLLFVTKSHSQSQSLPITSYGVWDRGAGVVDYSNPNSDFIKGIEISANWDEIQPTGLTSFDFSLFQQKLDLAVTHDKKIRFSINVGPDCPSWLFSNGVPLVYVTIAPNSNQNYANRHPHYLDPDYKAYYFELIRRFALFLRNQPQEKFDHIAFVQVKTGATGDEAPYKGDVINPSYTITSSQWEAFRLEAFAKFKEYFNDVSERKIVLTFNNVDPLDEPDAYNYVMNQLDPVLGFGIKGGAYNRGHHLSDEQTYKEQWNPFLINPTGRKLFSASEMDQSWSRGFFALNYEIGFYWSALGGINTGLSCTNITESAMTYALANPGIIDIFKMYNRYAQQVYPASATTAFSVFHEGLNSADTVKFPVATYGTANRSNIARYQNICEAYVNRGARLDDLSFVTSGQVNQRENQQFYNDVGWEICEGNIERFMTQINPDATSIGLFRVRGTITSTSSKYDRFARSFENSTGKNTMYFQLHNELPATNKNLKFTIIWLDKYPGSSWAFKYRNSLGLQTIPFTGTGTNQWKTEIFNIIDGTMNQGGLNGSDFMLVNTDADNDIFNGIEMNIIGVGIQPQTINFNPLPFKKIGDADFNPGATASSGLAITYTSSNLNVATIVNNMIHIVGLGSTTITASQAGNNGYNPATSVVQELTVYHQTTISTVGNNTWICPAGINKIKVEAWGGGGGGGGTSLAGFGGGGAGGSYVINENVSVVPETSYNVTVGAGGEQSGNGGANGNNGINTTFGSTTPVIANGGIGGSGTTATGQLGAGGTNSGGSGGTVAIGLPGASGTSGSGGAGGSGAGAMGGAGGASKTSVGNGIAGTSPGGGGGGAYGATSGSNKGAAGGNGQIIITSVGVPNAPTIGTATVSGVSGQASISFTAPVFNGNSTITSYTATSSPGGFTGTLSQSGSGTIIMTGLTSGTAYTFTLRATNSIGQSAESAASNSVTPYKITTWDGGAWSNGTPTASDVAIINDNFLTTDNGDTAGFSTRILTVNANKTFTINTGHNITVAGAVTNNGTFTVSNNANLIQGGTTNINSGNVIVKRDSDNMKLYDYTLWSSPVAGQNLKAFSPETLDSRFYTYNSSTNQYNAVTNPNPTTTPFATATGYLIRAPNNWTANTSTTFRGIFTGVPNNGTVEIPGLLSGKYYAVGNPYPSTINVAAFYTENPNAGTLYFWRKTNGVGGTAYATRTNAGGVASTIDGLVPSTDIAVGQGFFVSPSANMDLKFTNTMRATLSTSTVFLRTTTVERNRIWLNLTNTSGVFSQMLVSYMAEATQGVDSLDGKYINDAPIALTSIISAGEYTIQGRALPFTTSDTVQLGFKTNVAGNYTIALDHVDGLFTGQQAIYLKDNITGNEIDLKVGSYTFNAPAGIDNARFLLKYQRTLNVDAPEFNENNVRIYLNNETLYVNSGTSVIDTIEVYDIQGRLIAHQKAVKATTATINNLNTTKQVLIVKVKDQNGKVVIKKTVN